MESLEFNRIKIGFRITIALLAPFILFSMYLLFSRWPWSWFTTFTDYAGEGLSVLLGAAMIATLPLSREARVLFLVLYVPPLCFILFLYALQFVGMVFGDWL